MSTSNSSKSPRIVLLTGASGYLGQHLLWHWMHPDKSPQENDRDESTTTTPTIIVALFHQNPEFSRAVLQSAAAISASAPHTITVIPRQCNLMDPSSMDALFQDHPSFDVCVHTAALSSPQACQQDPIKARAMNVPEYLFTKLSKKGEGSSSTRIIALSTDQVYDGTTDNLYVEEDDDQSPPQPVNVYGKTKLEMEDILWKIMDEVVILRSSIILGPKAPITIQDAPAHDTFFHFCASRRHQPTTFFTNEYRNVVSVSHVCRIITHFMTIPKLPIESSLSSASSRSRHQHHQIYHMGGPVKVNRMEMAQAVFDYLGYDCSVLVAAQQTNPQSPLDIGMDSRKLERATNIAHEPSTLMGMVEETLGGIRGT